MLVGHIAETWLYPVKSMAGSPVESVSLDELGVIGDRHWSMIDAGSGDVAWGKRFPRLMNLAASYVGEPPAARCFGDDVPPVCISFPDGSEVLSSEDVDAAVSAYAEADLTLKPLQSPDNRDHYRWSEPLDEAAIMKILGIKPGEAPPDLSVYDEELVALLSEFYAPPGTYNDMAPIHLLTTASLAYMEQLSGETFDRRRFRPNFLVETPGKPAPIEFSWVGKRLRIGDVTLRVAAKTIRCSMPARGQAANDLPVSPGVAKAIYENTNRFLGAYLSVETPGEISPGDAVELLDA
jgi:uncharacterized protein YcbX